MPVFGNMEFAVNVCSTATHALAGSLHAASLRTTGPPLLDLCIKSQAKVKKPAAIHQDRLIIYPDSALAVAMPDLIPLAPVQATKLSLK